MPIEFIDINQQEQEENKIQKIEVRSQFGLPESNDSEYVLNDLATERVNAFDWKNVTTNSDKFNDFLKKKKNWMKLYKAAKASLLTTDSVIHLIKSNDNNVSINLARSFNSKYDVLADEIVEVSVEYHKFEFSDSPYSMVITYKKNKNAVYMLKGKSPDDEQLVNLEKQIGEYKVNETCSIIPVVKLYCLPDEKSFYQWSQNDSKELDLLKDVITDQILNSMQKLKRIDSADSVGIDTSKDDKKHYTELSSHDGLSEDGQNKASQMLYSPSDSIARFRDTYDWFEEKIRSHGKSIKDDDQDSAQKSRDELWSINRTATDMLEINKDCFESWIKELVIKFHDIQKDKELDNKVVEVTVPFKTITTAVLNTANSSGENNDAS